MACPVAQAVARAGPRWVRAKELLGAPLPERAADRAPVLPEAACGHGPKSFRSERAAQGARRWDLLCLLDGLRQGGGSPCGAQTGLCILWTELGHLGTSWLWV